ncbi:hypothetical protein [Qipengyuania zhejiangensis]|uniref:hypothetical protein n=1 Tax=Qipengyuania zhejiangensis TaxID=3077782 RepID=UPI002D76D4A1|nr:hypothetical protein [Qipengyuania sp. Z2]
MENGISSPAPVGVREDVDCECLRGLSSDAAGDQVLVAVCRAAQNGNRLTIWDLPKVIDLDLAEIFAAVRVLEMGKFVHVGDNPADPFGATVELGDGTIQRLRTPRAG